MPRITFQQTDDDEAIIRHDGEAVGDLYRHEDPLTGRPVYIYYLTMSCDLVLSGDSRCTKVTMTT